MKSIFSTVILFALPGIMLAQTNPNLSDGDIIKLYKGLRVADVSDGMDLVGLNDVGLLDPEIEALWKDIDEFKHMFCGIAVTVRYVPTNRVFPTNVSKEEYEKWRDEWYGKLSPEPFMEHLKPGSVVVIDNAGDGDTGSTGSNNSMLWVQKGAVGIVSAGGVRDTDEIIKQQIPVYMDISKRGRGIRPGRNEVESVQKPVVIGGVLIRPGDVIVADGDGVIVVPRDQAVPVAKAAHEILSVDKAQRKKLYQELGIPIDFTVED
ncbi:MAG: RraA family protein [Cyclobacteriaceae bacterium]|nr:RraA family protein [Cyclobacteriaceae bacterium]